MQDSSAEDFKKVDVILIFLKTCRLSLAPLLILFFLPSLLASIIIFSLFSLFLFFPIICVLTAIIILPAFVVGVPIASVGLGFVRIVALAFGKCPSCGAGLEVVRPECVDLDKSEVPSFGESSEEEEMKEGTGTQDLLGFEVMDHTGTEEYKSFYEILSYWRRKERGI